MPRSVFHRANPDHITRKMRIDPQITAPNFWNDVVAVFRSRTHSFSIASLHQFKNPFQTDFAEMLLLPGTGNKIVLTLFARLVAVFFSALKTNPAAFWKQSAFRVMNLFPAMETA